MTAGARRGEPERVAAVVVGHVVVAGLDPGGDVGEQRSGARIGQRGSGYAAQLQPRCLVGQQLGLGRRVSLGQTACGRLGGDQPLGHDQLGEPAPQLPALAGPASRQRGRTRTAAQPCLGRVDLGDGNRGAGNGGREVGAHVTVTFTAGE